MKAITPKSVLTALALFLWPLTPVPAQEKSPAPAPAQNVGQLGEKYFGVSAVWYSYEDLPIDAHGLNLEFNWPITPQLDFTSTFDWLETESYLGVKAEMQTLLAGVRGYTNKQQRVSFYAEALGGVAAAKADFIHEDAFALRVGGGAEIHVTPSFTITTFAYYLEYATDYADGGSFYYGVKGNVWVHQRVGFTASYSRNDDGDSTATLGLNFRF